MSLNQHQLDILRAIADGQTSQDQITVTLDLDTDLVEYYLDEMKNSGYIQGSKGHYLNVGSPEYLVVSLTDKGKVAANNPQDLIKSESPIAIYNQSGNFGIGHMSGGTIQSGAKVAGVINEAEQRNLAEAAAQIQQLLEQLEKSYPANTTAGKMAIATEAIKQIEANPTLTGRVLSAIRAGSVSALESFLNHPAASFVIGGLQDWQETRRS
jgi:predicted transcriptional regulator